MAPTMDLKLMSMNHPVESDSCLGRFCFNIPEGTCMILFPGASILFAGIVTLLVVYNSSSFELDDFMNITVLCLVIGVCMTLASVVYWLLWFLRNHRKSKTNRNAKNGNSRGSRLNPRDLNSTPVELVGVYRINNHATTSLTISSPSVKYISDDVGDTPTFANRRGRDIGHDNQAMVHSPSSIQRRPTTASTSRLSPAALEEANGHESSATPHESSATLNESLATRNESSAIGHESSAFAYGDAHDLAPAIV